MGSKLFLSYSFFLSDSLRGVGRDCHFKNNKSKQIHFQSSQGTALIFFIAAMIPFLVFLLIFGFEIDSFYKERGKLERYAQMAALMGANNLPFLPQAKIAAEKYVESQGIAQSSYSVNAAAREGVSVQINAKAPIRLASLFNLNQELSYSVYARAQLNPRNVDIFVDNSTYLAPDVLDEFGNLTQRRDAWGRYDPNNQDVEDPDWPRAQLFDRKKPRVRGQDMPPIIATQQCFNPAFSALKEASIRIYDFLTMSPLNSVGLMLGPGKPEPITIVRDVISDSTSLQPLEIDAATGVTNRLCLALSQYEDQHLGYQIPPKRGESYSNGSNFIFASDGSESLINSNISAREAIWSRAVMRTYGSGRQQNYTVNFVSILQRMRERLLLNATRPDRGNLDSISTYTGIIFLGDLPWHQNQRLVSYNVGTGSSVLNQPAGDEIRNALRRFAQEAFDNKTIVYLYVVYFKHAGNYFTKFPSLCFDPGVSDTLAHCTPYYEDSDRLRTFIDNFHRELKQADQYDYFRVKLFRSPDISSLSGDLVNHLGILDRSAILVR